jgi:hypothetical protein
MIILFKFFLQQKLLPCGNNLASQGLLPALGRAEVKDPGLPWKLHVNFEHLFGYWQSSPRLSLSIRCFDIFK